MDNCVTRSLLAGILIGIGGMVNVSVGGGIIGALLFSLGLLTVIENKYLLFTGKCGDVRIHDKGIHQFVRVSDSFKILSCNMFGIALFSLMCKAIGTDTTHIIEDKMSIPFYILILKGVGCGMLMQIASMTKDKVITIMCVMAFILSGFEHCIANFFYLGCSSFNDVESLKIFYNSMIGNVIGGQIISRLQYNH